MRWHTTSVPASRLGIAAPGDARRVSVTTGTPKSTAARTARTVHAVTRQQRATVVHLPCTHGTAPLQPSTAHLSAGGFDFSAFCSAGGARVGGSGGCCNTVEGCVDTLIGTALAVTAAVQRGCTARRLQRLTPPTDPSASEGATAELNPTKATLRGCGAARRGAWHGVRAAQRPLTLRASRAWYPYRAARSGRSSPARQPVTTKGSIMISAVT